MPGTGKDLPTIGTRDIGVLESGINREGVDSLIRHAVLTQAIGVSLLIAAGKMNHRLASNLRGHILAFEKSAQDQERIRDNNITTLGKENSGLNDDQIFSLRQRNLALDANAEYIRNVSFATSNFFVDYIMRNRRLREIALQVGRAEKGRLRSGKMQSGYDVTKGLVKIQI